MSRASLEQSDRIILAAMQDRNRFKNLRHAIPESMVSGHTVGMLAWFDLYWNQYPEHKQIDVDALIALIQLRSGKQDQNVVGLTLALAESLKLPVPQEAVAAVSQTLNELDLSGKAARLLGDYNNGEDIDLSYELLMLSRQTRQAIASGNKPTWADSDILEYLMADSDDGGIKLDIPVIGDNIKGLHGGDNILIAAPTDKGKTSLLCRIAVDAAKRARTVHPERPLLYLVNEGTARKIVNRLYQTATGLPRAEMLTLAQQGKLEPMYCAVVGRRDAIRVQEVHGKNIAQVARIIEQHNPYMVITDMTGRIRAVSNKGGGANDIGQLEEVWDGMRELAALYDFIHVGTAQVSIEGNGLLYPPLTAIQNSKTGIQTTVDLAIMMGINPTPGFEHIRGLWTPKNKLARSGSKSETRVELHFIPEKNEWK